MAYIFPPVIFFGFVFISGHQIQKHTHSTKHNSRQNNLFMEKACKSFMFNFFCLFFFFFTSS